MFGLLGEVVLENKDNVLIIQRRSTHFWFELQNMINVGLAKRVMHWSVFRQDWFWGYYFLKWFQTVYWRLLAIVGKDWLSIDCIQPQWLLENGSQVWSMSTLVEDCVLKNGQNGTRQMVSC